MVGAEIETQTEKVEENRPKMRLRTRTYSENITAGHKRRATNRSFTDPDPKRYLNHSLSIPRYPETRGGFFSGYPEISRR